MRHRLLIPVIILAAAIVAGCRIDPPLHLRQSMGVGVKAIWKAEVQPEGVKPNGMSLYIFRDGTFFGRYITADVDSCTVQLEPGKYRIFMISLTEDEYGGMEFFNMDSFDDAYVSLNDTWLSWYTPEDGEVLIQNPEPMVVGISDEFEITEEMIREWMENNPGYYSGESNVNIVTVTVPLYPRNVVSLLWATIYSDNADVLKAVRATISGMARTFMLTQDRTGDEEGTQILEDWSLTIDKPETRVGHLDCIITTFGLPRGELPSPLRDPALNIATLLVDNTTIDSYKFLVGDKIRLDEPVPDGYRLLYRLILGTVEEPAMHPPDVKPADEESGFDASVGDWDEGEIVEVGM